MGERWNGSFYGRSRATWNHPKGRRPLRPRRLNLIFYVLNGTEPLLDDKSRVHSSISPESLREIRCGVGGGVVYHGTDRISTRINTQSLDGPTVPKRLERESLRLGSTRELGV